MKRFCDWEHSTSILSGVKHPRCDAVQSRTNRKTKRHDRDHDVFIHSSTLACLLSGCIPCLYKVFPGGKDEASSKLSQYKQVDSLFGDGALYPANQRPELCPRSRANGISAGVPESEQQLSLASAAYNGYHGLYFLTPDISAGASAAVHTIDENQTPFGSSTVLTVGDGDFSFSLSIAEHIEATLGRQECSRLTATSHESKHSVLKTYHFAAPKTLQRLQNLGVRVLHDVDATDLASEKRLRNPNTQIEGQSGYMRYSSSCAEPQPQCSTTSPLQYDRVIWNFPCVSIDAGADGQTSELEHNQQLLRLFFQNVLPLLRPKTGEVHVTHKTVEPFSWWGIKALAAESGFYCAYTIVFDR